MQVTVLLDQIGRFALKPWRSSRTYSVLQKISLDVLKVRAL